jgi:hypothetical protein
MATYDLFPEEPSICPTKTCEQCGKTKTLYYFDIKQSARKSANVPGYHRPVCKLCRKSKKIAKCKNWKYHNNRKPNVLDCSLCNERVAGTKDIVIDHDHNTGEFRSYICSRCNNRLASIDEMFNPGISGMSPLESLMKYFGYVVEHSKRIQEPKTQLQFVMSCDNGDTDASEQT